MKSLFTAIRHSDLEIVKQLLEKNPKLVACTATQPPKKDDGQSPLQVALKTGHFDIADYLLSLGADVNFIEDEACCNEWRAPVLHDAITAAVMCSRWNVNSPIYGGLKVFSTQEKADRAFDILNNDPPVTSGGFSYTGIALFFWHRLKAYSTVGSRKSLLLAAPRRGLFTGYPLKGSINSFILI